MTPRVIRRAGAALLTICIAAAGPLVAGPARAGFAGPGPLTAVHSGKCLDIWAKSPNPGGLAVQMPCAGADRWTLVKQPIGDYWIVNERTGLCLNVYQATFNDSGFVIQWPCGSGLPNDLWRPEFLIVNGRLALQLRVRHSGKALVVFEATVNDGGFVVQDGRPTTRLNDLWRI